jgi:hypothetical protein
VTVPSDQSAGRRDNGLVAPSFVLLAEVDATIGEQLLLALGRARIAAYLEPAAEPARQLLYAAAMERSDARTIVSRVWRASADAEPDGPAVSAPDLLHGRDPDSEFQALVAGWHVDTVAAIRSAERDLSREDADWRARISPPPAGDSDEEEHFIPPPPPPLPRLAATTVGAILLIALSIFVFAASDWLDLGVDLTFLTGIGGLLLGAGMLIMKLRPQPEEDDDDGAII